LLEPSQVSPGRLLRDGARALAWALLFFALIAPPFVFGFRYWFGLEGTPKVRAMFPSFDAVFGQILVIALPEEAFFRGYVQTRLDRVFSARKLRILGADLGFAIPLTSLLFAIGHLLTLPNPGRLAVFFPSLLFGFLRVRTGGIGAPVAFHVMCNLLSGALARGYGLGTGG
jgi:hypothetical protein